MGFRKKQTKTKTNQQPITSSDPFPAPTKKNPHQKNNSFNLKVDMFVYIGRSLR